MSHPTLSGTAPTETSFSDNETSTSRSDTEWNVRNVAIGVAKTLARVRAVVPTLSSGSLAILESLLYCLMAHQSSRQSELERSRFLRSVVQTARTLSSIQNQDTNAEQDLFKYWANVYMLRCLRVPTGQAGLEAEWPKTVGDKPIALFHGWVRRKILRAVVKHDASFIYSLTMAKRMWNPVSQYKIALALDKHEKALGTAPPALKPDILTHVRQAKRNSLSGWRGRVSPQANETVVFEFEGTKVSPSVRACLQATIAEGGALSLYPKFEPPPPVGNVFIDLRRLLSAWDDWRVQTHNLAIVGACRSFDARERRWAVRVSLVLEPGKVRILSVGDGHLGTALQPMQDNLLRCVGECSWSVLKEETDTVIQRLHSDLASFIGGSVDREDEAQTERAVWGGWNWWSSAEDIRQEMAVLFGEVGEFFWFSGDFSAATDNLHGEISKAVLSGLPTGLVPKVMDSFISNDITYPDFKYKLLEASTRERLGLPEGNVRKGRTIQQKNGQLMGHVLSFPFLCIANVGVYRAAVDRYCGIQMRKRLDRVGRSVVEGSGARRKDCVIASNEFLRYFMLNTLAVQGDDILFPAPVDFFPIWRDTCREAGLLVSPGKNFISLSHACFCSRLYDMRCTTVKRVGYLNLKLVTGINVKGGGNSSSTPTELGRNITTMVEHAPWTRCAVFASFMRFRKDFMSWVQPNIFLPVHLGGFGVDIRLAPEEWYVTKEQRILAAMFINDQSLALYWKAGVKWRNDTLEAHFILPKLKPDPSIGHVCDLSTADDTAAAVVDSWQVRFAAIKQSVTGSMGDADVLPRLARIKRDHRQQPISDRGLMRYWNLQFVSVDGGAPPGVRTVGAEAHYRSSKIAEKRRTSESLREQALIRAWQEAYAETIPVSERDDFQRLLRQAEDLFREDN